jgi:malate dehydrogenase
MAIAPVRVAISGAAGRTAYSLLFRIANGGLFGLDQAVELSLQDVPDAHPQLEARVIELRDCAFPLLASVRISTEPESAFGGADWIILLGGTRLRSTSQSRHDLLRENAPIMVAHGRAINWASPTARVLVAISPSNTNCLIAMSQAQDVPKEHWFALNQQFRMRAIAMVAERAGVPVTQVTRLTVWGNNSENVFVDLRNARIANRPALEVIRDADWTRNVLEPAIAERASEIVRLTGGSPAGSAAQAILTTIRAITVPTPFEHWFSAGVLSDGSYGVPRGLVFGFPLATSDGKTWSIPQGHYLDEHAHGRIAGNVAELELEASSVSHLLGKA